MKKRSKPNYGARFIVFLLLFLITAVPFGQIIGLDFGLNQIDQDIVFFEWIKVHTIFIFIAFLFSLILTITNLINFIYEIRQQNIRRKYFISCKNV